MSRNKEHRGAAFGGRPIGSVFFVSARVFKLNGAKIAQMLNKERKINQIWNEYYE